MLSQWRTEDTLAKEVLIFKKFVELQFIPSEGAQTLNLSTWEAEARDLQSEFQGSYAHSFCPPPKKKENNLKRKLPMAYPKPNVVAYACNPSTQGLLWVQSQSETYQELVF